MRGFGFGVGLDLFRFRFRFRFRFGGWFGGVGVYEIVSRTWFHCNIVNRILHRFVVGVRWYGYQCWMEGWIFSGTKRIKLKRRIDEVVFLVKVFIVKWSIEFFID